MANTIILDELARLPSLYMPVANWQQDKVAFYWDKTGRIELYEINLATKNVRQISHGEVPRVLRAGFVWNRVGTAIVFAKDREGNEQHDLYRIELQSGEVEQLTSDGSCQKYPAQFSPDDRWLLVASNKAGQMNVWKMRTDGSEWAQLTAYRFPAQPVCWSPDGAQIAFVTNESQNLKNLDGYIMDAAGGNPHIVFHIEDGAQDVIDDWHPDGRLLAVTSDASGINRAGILDIESGDVQWLSPAGLNESAGKFSEDGRWLSATLNHEAQIRPVIYEVATGNRKELNLPPGIGFGSAFVNNNKDLLLSYSTDTQRTSFYLYHLDNDSYEVILPAAYGSIDRSLFVPAEHLYYPSTDGLQIPAILYHPHDIAPGTRLPAIVIVHGGPTGQFFRGFDALVQYLVNSGYVVLEPNIRGSSGYGVQFRDMAICDWGGGDLEDLAAGARFLQSLPYVDPERLGIFGISYGGYMTYIAVTKKPELWKAAVAAVGITDLPRLYNESMEHFKYYLRQQMGDPEQNADLWRDRSAVNFAQNLQARLLILHGRNDPRCPIDQAEVFRDKLLASGRKLGSDFEYVDFGDQGHWSNDIQQKLQLWQSLTRYFADHL